MFPNESPPRAALGYTMMLLAGHARARRLPGFERDAEVEAGDRCGGRRSARRARADVPAQTNLAKQLAWSLLDRLPVIEGSGFMAAVARRWKTQINENANSAAAAEELPEATHNTVVGYEQPETMRDHQYVVFLASDSDLPRNRERDAAVDRAAQGVAIDYQRVSFDGRADSAQACAAISLGDYVSFYLALLYGVDPTKTEALTLVKTAMSEFDPLADEHQMTMPLTRFGD